MKKLILTLSILLGVVSPFIMVSGSVQAASCNGILCTSNNTGVCNNQDATSTPAVCGDNSSGSKTNPIIGSGGVLDKVVSILTFVAGAFAVIMVIVSGIRMMLSRGDANGFNSARNGLIFAVTGLVVAILTRSVVLFILKYI